jgi:hypothetical protein
MGTVMFGAIEVTSTRRAGNEAHAVMIANFSIWVNHLSDMLHAWS